jgi:hypothetical protein
VVDGSSLENWRTRKGIGGSNPSSSAISSLALLLSHTSSKFVVIRAKKQTFCKASFTQRIQSWLRLRDLCPNSPVSSRLFLGRGIPDPHRPRRCRRLPRRRYDARPERPHRRVPPVLCISTKDPEDPASVLSTKNPTIYPQSGYLRIAEEDWINVFEEVALVLDGDQGAFRAIVPRHLKRLCNRAEWFRRY